ncbi:hypothetical protein HZA99_03750 [Candidatus Woesearchaeota archaeon]|nr:hypothetical protein [Candidatus Woesearchaeota archaeon]
MKFLIESSVLQKLKPQIQELLTLLKTTIESKQPIYIRHHADADGYTAGIALERVLVPLIGAQHKRERDVSLYFQRLPSLTPYYSYEDATRDIQNFLRTAEQFSTKPPLFLFLDLGSGPENIPSYHKVKIYGAALAVIDHHPADEHITPLTEVHINPHLIGSTYDYSAGMLCAEIGNLLALEIKNLPEQNFAFIAAVSGTADKVASEEYKKYMSLASHKGFSKEFVQQVAKAIDYEAHILGPTSGRELVQDLLGKDEKKQHKHLALIEKQLEKLFKAQLTTCLHYAQIEEKKHFSYVKVPIEDVLSSRNAYPPRGKAIGIVQQHFNDQGKKAITVGVGKSSFNFRASTEIEKFDVHAFMDLCKKKVPYAQINGGGHRVAGSVTFVAAAKEEVENLLDEYVGGL